MVRYTGPKNRIARKFSTNLFGRLRNPMLHKEHPPGVHGAKKRKKSDFGLQLAERQKLKALYGMLTQKQLVNAYKKALTRSGNTANNLVEQLECRLDNIVYRLRLAPTIFAAQQLVSHGHVHVDSKKVDRRSFLVRPGMAISLKNSSREMLIVKAAQENIQREIPSYLSLSEDRQTGTLLLAPQVDQVPFPLPVNIPLVCEFISHTA